MIFDVTRTNIYLNTIRTARLQKQNLQAGGVLFSKPPALRFSKLGTRKPEEAGGRRALPKRSP